MTPKKRDELVQEGREPPKNDLATLQTYSFKLIHELMTLWDGFESKSSRGKGRKLSWGSTIHRMIIDACRYHSDITKLAEIVGQYEELKTEHDLAERSGILNRKVQAVEQASTAIQTTPQSG